jgi:predicted P-loop ATPase/phage/plasmid primase-like uncharacterized protein
VLAAGVNHMRRRGEAHSNLCGGLDNMNIQDLVHNGKYPTAYWEEWSQKIISSLGLKKTAKDEYHGACPNCGGNDRFWIKNINGEVKINCRGCEDFKSISDIMRRDGILPDVIRQAKSATPDLSDFDDAQPYHIRKGVGLHNAKLDGDTVVVPIISASGQRVGIQRIAPNGRKLFSKGMAKEGAFSVIGGKLEGTCYVAEGWATAASVYEASGRPCVFALDAGNLPKVVDALSEVRPDAEFIVAADNDEKGIKAAIESGVKYALPPQGMDWNDLHVAKGLDAVAKGLSQVNQPGAENAELALASSTELNFVFDSRGNIPFNHYNAIEIVTKADEWRDVFAFDEFAQRKMVMQPIPGTSGNPDKFKPRELRDADYISVIKWFNSNGFLRANKNTICDVVDSACLESIISPVKHWLEAVGDKAEEDPMPDEYLDTWAITMLGVEPHDEKHAAYVYEVSRKWLIAAVARAMDPGCKADGVLILEGSQGAGKSTALRILASDDWFGDALPQMGTKDASDYLRGKWIVELAELSNINKAEVEIVKAFVSRTEERFRPAYGRSEICYPRHCIFAGTTNKSDYLRDETGNRRFWPVKCGKIDTDMIRQERDRLWGEAVRAYRTGEEWWLTGAAEEYARIEQEKRLAVDEWTGPVQSYCEYKSEVAILQVAEEALGISPKEVSRPTQNRISAILSSIGFVRNGAFTSGELRNKARFVKEA